MTKGQQQMLNNGVGTNRIHGLRVFCVSFRWCLILPTSFSISTIPIFITKGVTWGASGWISAWGFLPLDWSGPLCPSVLFCFFSCKTVTYVCKSFVTATSSCPVWQRWLYFHAEWKWYIDIKFAKQFKIWNEETIGLPEFLLTLSLKINYWIYNFY